MPRHPFTRPSGRIEFVEVGSAALANNLLGDPSVRTVPIYLPADYDASTEEYPLLVDLAGFTGSGFSHIGWSGFRENVPQRIDRLISERKMGAVVVAFPDCFTALGGNQYVNSVAMGDWEVFLGVDLIAAIEAKYRVIPRRDHRALFGKSSGGYGALVQGMLHADIWGAVACHSGDVDFELCYRPEFPRLLRALDDSEASIEIFIEKLQSASKVSGSDMETLMMLAMAATYDPDPGRPFGIRLPVTPDTCELIPERWDNWLAWDPLHMLERNEVRKNLASLRGLYLDCGSKDQYNLIYGARQLERKLKRLGIGHYYEEFADNHSAVDYRMDSSLPYLYAAIAP